MAVDAQNPGKILGNGLLQVEQHARELVELKPAVRLQVGPPAVEKHLRLEHKAIAHHPDIGPVAEDLAQLAEKIRPVAGELIDLLGERQIELLAKIGNALLRILVLLLRGVERLRQRGKLGTQLGELPVQGFDLRQRIGGNLLLTFEPAAKLGDPARRGGGTLLLAFELRGQIGDLVLCSCGILLCTLELPAQLGDFALRRRGRSLRCIGCGLRLLAFGFDARQIGAQLRNLVFELRVVGFLH